MSIENLQKALSPYVEKLNKEELSCLIVAHCGTEFSSKRNGIAPLLTYLEQHCDKQAMCAVDKVIGKSAAMLFVKMGVTAVYGKVMSAHAESVFRHHGVFYQYERIVPFIQNRAKNGMCPMEQAVLEVENIEEAYLLLQKKSAELKNAVSVQ